MKVLKTLVHQQQHVVDALKAENERLKASNGDLQHQLRASQDEVARLCEEVANHVERIGVLETSALASKGACDDRLLLEPPTEAGRKYERDNDVEPRAYGRRALTDIDNLECYEPENVSEGRAVDPTSSNVDVVEPRKTPNSRLVKLRRMREMKPRRNGVFGVHASAHETSSCASGTTAAAEVFECSNASESTSLLRQDGRENARGGRDNARPAGDARQCAETYVRTNIFTETRPRSQVSRLYPAHTASATALRGMLDSSRSAARAAWGAVKRPPLGGRS